VLTSARVKVGAVSELKGRDRMLLTHMRLFKNLAEMRRYGK